MESDYGDSRPRDTTLYLTAVLPNLYADETSEKLLEFFDKGSHRLVNKIAVKTALPEVDIIVIYRLDSPRDDPTLVRHPTTKPTL